MKKAVKERYEKLVELGCIVCLRHEETYTPPEIHHINGRKGNGDFETIPLCVWHHREGSNCETHVSRHPFKFEFEQRYGDEMEMLEEVNNRIK